MSSPGKRKGFKLVKMDTLDLNPEKYDSNDYYGNIFKRINMIQKEYEANITKNENSSPSTRRNEELLSPNSNLKQKGFNKSTSEISDSLHVNRELKLALFGSNSSAKLKPKEVDIEAELTKETQNVDDKIKEKILGQNHNYLSHLEKLLIRFYIFEY